jgi:uncharacterized membrane protein YgdD (TMEM256/DUF423 family)
MNWTHIVGLGSLLAGVSVALGAFGAHALKAHFDVKQLEVFGTAVKYQMYHGLGVIAVGLLLSRLDTSLIRIVSYMMITGTLLFSGSLYVYLATENKTWAMVTPFGGGFLVIAWLLLCYGMLTS